MEVAFWVPMTSIMFLAFFKRVSLTNFTVSLAQLVVVNLQCLLLVFVPENSVAVFTFTIQSSIVNLRAENEISQISQRIAHWSKFKVNSRGLLFLFIPHQIANVQIAMHQCERLRLELSHVVIEIESRVLSFEQISNKFILFSKEVFVCVVPLVPSGGLLEKLLAFSLDPINAGQVVVL